MGTHGGGPMQPGRGKRIAVRAPMPPGSLDIYEACGPGTEAARRLQPRACAGTGDPEDTAAPRKDAELSYFSLILITLLLGVVAQVGINSTYRKWGRVPNAVGITGAQAARRMLDANGLYNVGIDRISGELTDNFDPRDNRLHLSQSTYDKTSVAAIAIACHEAGHAVQHATGYKPIKVRQAIVPVAQFASNAWIFILIIGFILNSLSVVWFAIILYACVVLFEVATLPVEFNASSRAIEVIGASYPLPEEQLDGCKKVLRAAAFTYVASALSSLLQLVYFAGLFDRN